MNNTQIKKKFSDADRGVMRRADGTVRQAHINDPETGEFDMAMYVPGTLLKPGRTLEPSIGSRCYHWASMFTDEELSQPGRLFGDGFTGERLKKLREEAALANSQKRTVEYSKEAIQ